MGFGGSCDSTVTTTSRTVTSVETTYINFTVTQPRGTGTVPAALNGFDGLQALFTDSATVTSELALSPTSKPQASTSTFSPPLAQSGDLQTYGLPTFRINPSNLFVTEQNIEALAASSSAFVPQTHRQMPSANAKNLLSLVARQEATTTTIIKTITNARAVTLYLYESECTTAFGPPAAEYEQHPRSCFRPSSPTMSIPTSNMIAVAQPQTSTASFRFVSSSSTESPVDVATAESFTIHTRTRDLISSLPITTTSTNALIAPADLESMPLTTSISEPAIEPAAESTSTESFRVDLEALEACYVSSENIDQDNDTQGSCADITKAVSTCYDAVGPWTDPYDEAQSLTFRSCLCSTTPDIPHTASSPFWSNYTTCASCLVSQANVSFGEIYWQHERNQNFCSSPSPLAYLYIQRLRRWLREQHRGQALPSPLLSDAVAEIESLRPKFSTTPPLANLAYGSFAPVEGSLAAVTPVLTTFATGTLVEGVEQVATVTAVASWVRTGTGGLGFDAAAASSTAESRGIEALTSSLGTETGVESLTASLRASCGPGPCFWSAGSKLGPGLGILLVVVLSQVAASLVI